MIITLNIEVLIVMLRLHFQEEKIYANVYIDDRGGLIQVYYELLTLIEKIEKGEITHE